MIEKLIEKSFPLGLPYNSAAQLCLRLYCTVDGIPAEYHEACSKEGLAQTFTILSANGFVKEGESESALYGANFNSINDKGHWIEVMASILKQGNTRDNELGEELASCLTSVSN